MGGGGGIRARVEIFPDLLFTFFHATLVQFVLSLYF